MSDQLGQRLSPDDQRLLDALVECGFDSGALEGLSGDDRGRVEALVGLLELLEDYPVADADESLVHATMARIDRVEEAAAARLVFDAGRLEGEQARGRRFRVPDLISLAAIVLIGASVVWPTLSYLRTRAVDAGCSNNLRRMALAFDQYASDYEGALPIAHAGIFSGWNTQAHNVVNLGPLVEGGYCELGHLDCPGHRGQPGESYSYQWQLPGRRIAWSNGRIVLVLGDRNPIIDAARSGKVIKPLSVSVNHGGRGQNVLASDGQTVWLQEPRVRNDNIWLPRGASSLRSGVQPQDPQDVFLAH